MQVSALRYTTFTSPIRVLTHAVRLRRHEHAKRRSVLLSNKRAVIFERGMTIKILCSLVRSTWERCHTIRGKYDETEQNHTVGRKLQFFEFFFFLVLL